MTQLTEHFSQEEMGVVGAEQRLIDNALFLCEKILEPIRAKFGSVSVHDGYRNPTHNASVGGKATSFHMFEGGKAAADISTTVSIPTLFDWIRLSSSLPFDKVIMEYNSKEVPACVHIQVDSANTPRRQAYTGHTGAGEVYIRVGVK
jgi:hypothetical protein